MMFVIKGYDTGFYVGITGIGPTFSERLKDSMFFDSPSEAVSYMDKLISSTGWDFRIMEVKMELL